MLSEINQAEKDKCYIISDIYIYIYIYIIYIWNVLQNGDRKNRLVAARGERRYREIFEVFLYFK